MGVAEEGIPPVGQEMARRLGRDRDKLLDCVQSPPFVLVPSLLDLCLACIFNGSCFGVKPVSGGKLPMAISSIEGGAFLHLILAVFCLV